MQINPLFTKICAENDFYIFVSSDLDLWPLDLKFAPTVTLVQRYDYTKLEVSRRTDRVTDGVQHNAAL